MMHRGVFVVVLMLALTGCGTVETAVAPASTGLTGPPGQTEPSESSEQSEQTAPPEKDWTECTRIAEQEVERLQAELERQEVALLESGKADLARGRSEAESACTPAGARAAICQVMTDMLESEYQGLWAMEWEKSMACDGDAEGAFCTMLQEDEEEKVGIYRKFREAMRNLCF